MNGFSALLVGRTNQDIDARGIKLVTIYLFRKRVAGDHEGASGPFRSSDNLYTVNVTVLKVDSY